jgi:hypothetical protein
MPLVATLWSAVIVAFIIYLVVTRRDLRTGAGSGAEQRAEQREPVPGVGEQQRDRG